MRHDMTRHGASRVMRHYPTLHYAMRCYTTVLHCRDHQRGHSREASQTIAGLLHRQLMGKAIGKVTLPPEFCHRNNSLYHLSCISRCKCNNRFAASDPGLQKKLRSPFRLGAAARYVIFHLSCATTLHRLVVLGPERRLL